MAYNAHRGVGRRELAYSSEARCLTCPWKADDPLTVRSDSIQHVKTTLHRVQVETRALFQYHIE